MINMSNKKTLPNKVTPSRKVKIKIVKEVDAEPMPFSEIDRTNLVIGVGEVYGRDGSLPRTDLGTYSFYAEGQEIHGLIFLESDGSLSCSYAPPETCQSMKDAVKEDAARVYKELIDTKYKPLFDKYGLKDFSDVIRLNMSQEGLKGYLLTRWKPGEIIIRQEPDPQRLQGGIQNGNLGLYMNTYEYEGKFNTHPEYYIDFPGKIFAPNNFGGSQNPEEIKRWGRKIFAPKRYKFNTKEERAHFVSESYEKFKKEELIGFD